MGLLKALTKPTSTPRMVRRDLIAEEFRLMGEIRDLTDQHRLIEHVPEAANRAQYVLRKITRLEIQLRCVRSLAKEYGMTERSARAIS